MGARVEWLRARLVWQYASRGAFAPSAVERRVLCAAGQRGDGVGEHARRISYLSLCVGLFFYLLDTMLGCIFIIYEELNMIYIVGYLTVNMSCYSQFCTQ